jgi:hypothetical protein
LVPCVSSAVLDLVFVLDSSGSLGPDGWQQVTQFAASIVGQLPVAMDQTRFVLIFILHNFLCLLELLL